MQASPLKENEVRDIPVRKIPREESVTQGNQNTTQEMTNIL